MKATLALESGKYFCGESFGSTGETTGEVVFNTGMCGYQEILTDPSYCGQIVAMTYPHIGNYGINRADNESDRSYVQGFVVREKSRIFSNWRAEVSLDDFLKSQGVIAVEGIDTRALTVHIREAGAMRAVLSTGSVDPAELVKKAKDSLPMSGKDLVKEVMQKDIRSFPADVAPEEKKKPFKVVLIDYGCKMNIVHCLTRRGCTVTVVPSVLPADEIMKYRPDGIILSNGPGDPAAVTYAIETVKRLVDTGNKPIFGICLGHQILSLALGGSTYKLKFGHRGVNQPVKQLSSGKVEITSQNHGFNVDMDSLKKRHVEVTHINLNDQTVEGFRHTQKPIFSVQYHPEASPGPHDSAYLFDDFVKLMKK